MRRLRKLRKFFFNEDSGRGRENSAHGDMF